MPIQFSCPHCGIETNVADEYAGQSGPCSGCGKPITVPPLAGPSPFRAPARPSKRSTPIVLIVLLVLAGMVFCSGIPIALLLPAVQAAREAARRSQCVNNLKQIGLAMHNYHDAYKCFPPAYIPDENGQPMHSWRVLILPYLECGTLYDQYDFDEPWDSPANLALADGMPSVFRCPSDPTSGPTETGYAMIVGPKALSDGPTATPIREILDGTSNTIMVVEASGCGINWLEPRDLDLDEFGLQINSAGAGGIHSYHPGGVNVLISDGSVRFLSETIDTRTLEALITKAGGEAVGGF